MKSIAEETTTSAQTPFDDSQKSNPSYNPLPADEDSSWQHIATTLGGQYWTDVDMAFLPMNTPHINGSANAEKVRVHRVQKRRKRDSKSKKFLDIAPRPSLEEEELEKIIQESGAAQGSTGNLYRCGNCGQAFSLIQNLRRHRRTSCNAERPSIACPNCDKTFNRNDNLKRHIKQDHNPDQQTLS